jgi:hypothetical protein
MLALMLAAQAWLFTRPLHDRASYDEGVYLAALDDLRHGQVLGTQVFAAQFPGFYDLLRGLSFLTGVGVAPVRAGLVAITVLGTVGGWLIGRRYGGAVGGLLVAAFLAIAPPLDLFGSQVIADMPALGLMALSLGVATLAGPAAGLAAGALLAASLSVKLTAITVLPAVAWHLRGRVQPATVGFAAVVLALLTAHASALGDLWTSGVTYHSRARSTPNVIAHPHRQIFDQVPHRTPFFLLALLAVAAAITLFATGRPLRLWPLWSWVVLGTAFLFLHAPIHDNHLVLFPFSLAIATGAALGAAVQRLPRLPQYVTTALFAVAIVAGYVQQVHRVEVTRAPEPKSNLDAARALERLTTPKSMTIDDRPIISFLAHRRVVGPLVDLANLRFETDSLNDADVIRELPHADAVVVSRALRDRPVVLRALRPRFQLGYDRGGVAIWVRR